MMDKSRPAFNKKTRETADKPKNLPTKQSIDKEQENTKLRILHSGTLGKEENNKGSLLNNYKCQLMKFNKTWSDVQQKQDFIKATYNNLKRLRSLIVSENLPLPRPMPMFRIVEFLKDEEEQTESVTSQTTNCDFCEHESLLNDMKLLMKQKEELLVTVIELKSQLAEMEIRHHKELEMKEPVLTKNQEIAACLIEPAHSEMESSDGAMTLESKQMLSNSTSQLTEGKVMMAYNVQCECHGELARATAETEKLKIEVEQSENKFKILEGKLTVAQLELESLKAEKFNWTQKIRSLEVKESQTQAELCEMSQLYEGLCELKLKEEHSEALAALKMRFQKVKAENHEMNKFISKLQNELQYIKHDKEVLQECLKDSQKREMDLEVMVKKLKKCPFGQYDHKEIQTSQDVEFKKKLISIVNLLDLEDNKKEVLIKPFNQISNADAMIQHMKLFYNEFVSTNNCKKEQEKKLKYLEKECTDLNKGKESLEFRIHKLAGICKAYQGLIEGQGKEVQQMKELKTKLEEKTQKCESLSKRVEEMEALLTKSKDREIAFKKKYFKEKHSNRKKHKKKCNNWLTKIFDWRQTFELLSKRVEEMEALLTKSKDREIALKKKYFKEKHCNRKKHKKKYNNWLTKIFDWRQIVT